MASTCDVIRKSSRYDVYISNATIACIVAGVALTVVAFLYPVEWDFRLDPEVSAQENEQRRRREVETQNMVYTFSIVGVVLVTIAGILSAILLTKFILLEECGQTDDDMDEASHILPHALSNTPSHDHDTYSVLPKDRGEKTASSNKGTRELADSDRLQLNSASQQYGSTVH